MQLADIIDAMILAFFINAPIQLIITIAQWLLMVRFISIRTQTISSILSCLIFSYLSAYLLSLFFWFAWPLDPEWVMYNNRISIPAILGELVALPFWLKWYGYMGRKKSKDSE